MKGITFIIITFFVSLFAMAQTDTAFRLIRTIRADIAAFTVDNLDNVYILNSRNQLKKLDAKGDSVAVYNEIRRFGTATLLDASNPLKVLLYYKDFATIVSLDRQLNARNTIDLRKQNILQAKAIGLSYDNKIWIYDQLESKLKKIDEDGKLMLETPDLRQLLGKSPDPLKIFDESKYVYLYDSTYGVYVFDYYGTLKNNIMISRWKNFKVVDDYIFGSRADTLYRYEIKTFRYDEWTLPEQLRNSRSFNFTSTRLYALKEDRLEIYSIR